MNDIDLFKKAMQTADHYVRGIKKDQWNKESNCPGWSVRDLVNHLTSENWWVPELFAGKTVTEVGAKYDGDILGKEPVAAWENSVTLANEAVEKPGILEMTVHLSYADVPGKEYLSQLTLDRAIHGWDISHSTGQDDTLDPQLVEFLYNQVVPREKELRDSGLFGKKISVSESADLQTKLLALLGRKRA